MAEASENTTSDISYLWVVKNFSHWPLSEGNVMKTPFFSVKNCTDAKWCVTLSSVGDQWLQPGVELIATDSITALIKFSVIDTELSQLNIQCQNYSFNCSKKEFRFRRFIQKDTLLNEDNKLLCSGDLVLHCQITIADAIEENKEDYIEESASSILGENLLVLLENGYFADFEIVVKEKTFSCHKFVLAHRSKYFECMFRQSTKENHEAKLVLTDMEPNIFEKLLHYLYTDQVHVSEDEAFRLLLAADKFQLERLKALCEKKLYDHLCLGNAFKVFTFASMYNLEKLKLSSFLILKCFTKKVPTFEMLNIHPDNTDGVSCSVVSSAQTEKKGSISNTEGKADLVADIDSWHDASAYFRQTTINKGACMLKADFWCCTERKILAGKQLRIKNFMNQKLSDEKILSNELIASNEGDWDVQIYIEEGNENKVCDDDGDNEDDGGDNDGGANEDDDDDGEGKVDSKDKMDLYLYLELLECKKGYFSHEYKLSVINADNKQTYTLKGSFKPMQRKECGVFIMKVRDILSNKMLLQKGDLIMDCMLTTFQHTLYECTYNTIPSSDLVNNMSACLKYNTLADVVVKIQGEKFFCHEGILACYSTFYGEEYEASINSEEEEIEIDDIDPCVFRKLLSSMYSGKCELTGSEVLELLSIESKYLFLHTTSTFDKAFISALSVENAAQTLALVNSLSKKEKLQKYILEFITQNFEKVMKTVGWAEVAKEEDISVLCLMFQR